MRKTLALVMALSMFIGVAPSFGAHSAPAGDGQEFQGAFLEDAAPIPELGSEPAAIAEGDASAEEAAAGEEEWKEVTAEETVEEEWAEEAAPAADGFDGTGKSGPVVETLSANSLNTLIPAAYEPVIGYFKNPDASSKPMARMWFPDAAAGGDSDDLIEKQIVELAKKGFGGVEVTMLADGVSYRLDAATGEIAQVGEHSVGDGAVTFVIDELYGGDSVIYAVTEDTFNFPAPGVFATGVDKPASDYGVVRDGGRLALRSNTPGAYAVELSDGTSGDVSIAKALASLDLGQEEWDLVIHSYGPDGADANDPSASKITAINFGKQPLGDWEDIAATPEQLAALGVPKMDYVSGIGVYTLTFAAPGGWDENTGAYLDVAYGWDQIGSITVNGKTFPANNASDRVDIGGALIPGSNTIEIKLSSTLYGRAFLENSGYSDNGGTTEPTVSSMFGGGGTKTYEDGLTGAVLTPYTQIALADLSETSIRDLTVNYKSSPLGIDKNDNIVFGWKMASRITGQAQKGYRIAVRENSASGPVIWDSGAVASGLSVAIPYKGAALKAGTKYYWSAGVTDVFGDAHTAASWFETADGLDDAEWISLPGFSGNTTSLLFRTERALTGANPVSARLYMTALGAYDAYVNGEKAPLNGKSAVMAPGAHEAEEASLAAAAAAKQ